MKRARLHTKGFTLIASLLLLLLLSGLAIGLLMMVNAENRVGGSDLQNDLAYHAAEGGIEKMGSDLAAVLQNAQATTAAEICSVGGPTYGGSTANEPAMAGIVWKEYQVTPGALGSNCPSTMPKPKTGSNWNPISTGPYTGLWAQVIPISMQATAATVGGQEVSMLRSAQIALIPVFQFGVFCEGDCDFFSTPNLDFNGRVHTNGDLYLGVGAGNTLTFHHKLEAYGNVVEDYIPNGLTVSDAGDTGTVYIPTNDPGCTPNTSTSCVAKATNGDSNYGDGSVQGKGGNPPLSAYNTSIWNTFVSSTNHEIINGNYGSKTNPGTGARKLSLPFVNGTDFPYELIRRPPAGEDTTTALSTSREYHMAQIRVLLSDDPNDLPGGASDTTNNIRLANIPANSSNTAYNLPYGIATSAPIGTWVLPTLAGGSTYNTYFATASNAIPSAVNCNVSFSSTTTFNSGTWQQSACPPDWPYPPAPWANLLVPTGAPYTNSNGGDIPAAAPSSPNLAGGASPVVLPTFYPCPPAAPAPAYLPVAPNPQNIPTSPCPSGSAPPAPYYAVNGFFDGAAPPATSAIGSATTPAAAVTYTSAIWNLIDGWLRVEYSPGEGQAFVPVTMEWLKLGFARGVKPPTSPGSNPINPNAILLLQEPADRLTTAPTTLPNICTWTASATTPCPTTVPATPLLTTSATAPACTATNTAGQCKAWNSTPPQLLADNTGNPSPSPTATEPGMNWVYGVTTTAQNSVAGFQASRLQSQSVTRFNWYPINFYDAREGEARDVDQGNNSCTTNGLMNAVEIDVGNLQQWLQGKIPATGSSGGSVDYVAQNGYVLYFSDRRGMLLNPNLTSSHPAGTKSGDSGLEDVVNSSSQVGTPDGVLEPTYAGSPLSPSPPNPPVSPEDVNENGVLDKWGAANLGLGFYGTSASATTNLNANIVAASPDNPYSPRINSCTTTARKNWVSGARHVLKLVDGGLGNLPITPAGTQETVAGVTKTYYGGFTVASENPVYIQGDYNSVTSPTEDTFFSNPSNTLPANDEAGYVPAAVIGDAVTILSNSWDDRVSMLGISTNTDITYNVAPNAGNRLARTTSYRAAIIGGKNLAFPFPSWATKNPDYPLGTDGGVGNFLRFLEDWSTPNATLNYGGSLVSLYYATYGTGIFKCCQYSVYAPPTRNYIYDIDYTLPGGVGLPPGTPLFRDVETLGYRQLFTTRDSSAANQ